MFGRRKIIRSGDPDWDGREFDLDDPRVPPAIRALIPTYAGFNEFWSLYFCDTDAGGEWWLFDDAGDLVDAIWAVD